MMTTEPTKSTSLQGQSVNIGDSPEFVKVLIESLKYFSFLSKQQPNGPKGGKAVFKLKCNICASTNKSSVVSDKSAFSFTRHLKRFHTEQYDVYQKNTSDAKPKVTTKSSKSAKPQLMPYNKKDSAQIKFEKSMLKFVVLDSVPFNISERVGFHSLIKQFDPRLVIPSRRTLVRQLTEGFDSVINGLSSELKQLPDRSCHLILDIWTDRQKRSIIGFRGQFIGNDWSLHSAILGFKHFPVSHTGRNIKDMLDQFLSSTFGLRSDHFCTITVDNASNMISAFELPGISPTSTRLDTQYDQSLLVNENEKDPEDVSPEDVIQDETVEHEMTEAFQNWATTSISRNACLAHLLQLAIKEAITQNSSVRSITKRVNDIVNYFHSSSHWYTKLRETNGNLGLLKPCVTRWNSLYHSLKRIGDPKRETMIRAINAVLQDAKQNTKQKQSIPSCLTEDEISSIKILLQLLAPFANLTDDLQGDSITSSIVIMGVIKAVADVQAVFVDGNYNVEEDLTGLKQFQIDICATVRDRFTTDKTNGEKIVDPVTNKTRNVASINIFNYKPYIMAALLDPRVKQTPFNVDRTEEGDFFKDKLPRLEQALNLLQCEVESAVSEDMNELTITHESGSQSSTVSNDLPPSKKSKISAFAMVRQVIQSMPTASQEGGNEISCFMKMSILEETQSALLFWKKNEGTFPNLAKLAKKYLAMPATSGSAERLFSVAGSISRARRSRLTVENLEKVLCYQQSLLRRIQK